MSTRKEWKERARENLKRHYLLLVVLCLISSLVGLEYRGELISFGLSSGVRPENVAESGTVSLPGNLMDAWEMLVGSNVTGGADIALKQLWERLGQEEVRLGPVSLGRTRGVLASLVNAVSSGPVLVRIYAAVRNAVQARSPAQAVLVLLALFVYLALFGALMTAIYVVFRRVILEARTYEKVPLQRFLFLLRTRKWIHAARCILWSWLMLGLWALTIVGGFIKYFAFRMVPYIVAENPFIGAREAVALSERMMRGHKWECCKLEFSFLLWQALGILTGGVVSIFYTNPYHLATMAEYYAELRRQAREKKLPGADLLWDDYLYERADPDILRAAYRDVAEPVELPRQTGVRGFLADKLGVVLTNDPEEAAFEAAMERNARYYRSRLVVEGKAYPDRLSPFLAKPLSLPKWLEDLPLPQSLEIHPLRHYALSNLVLIFFFFCGIGWVWEVGLHLLQTGEIVNRGVMHGPWLPIYGVGTVLGLTLLYRLRSRPVVLFFAAILLAGVMEYVTGWALEQLYGGVKWWDYSGYFLNLHGRICAEGLLTFGVGGLVTIYVVAPLADDLLLRLRPRWRTTLAAVLIVLFLLDMLSSFRSPNTGKGVTDIEAAAPPHTNVSEIR